MRWPWHRGLDRWDQMNNAQRTQAFAVLLCGALFLFHFAWYSHWYIEDAAISFAYSRNLANGEGFVPWPGAEQVEGFSNPTWTLALAALDLVGLSPWTGGKVLGALFGLLGLPLAFRWTQEALGHRDDLLPVATPLLLALSPQYVAWSASGLENSIMVLCMAGGGAFLLREIRDERAFPWSGLWWSMLAVSRPEAPLYAVVAGVVGGFSILGRRGLRSSLRWAWRWMLLAAVPFLAWHLFAYAWFAWGAPNTYFAKLHDGGRFLPWEWSGTKARGWGYLRGYALRYGHGFLIILYLMAQVGFSRRRRWVGLALGVFTYLIMLPGIVWLWGVWGQVPLDGVVPMFGTDGGYPLWPFSADPEWWVTGRVFFMIGLAVIPPLMGIGRSLQGARALGYWLCTVVLFFAIYAGGDWMDGFRWMSLCCVPLTVLLVEALASATDRLPSGWMRSQRSVLIATVLSAIALLQIIATVQLIRRPDTSPYSVYRRVHYARLHQDRLDLDHATIMDVDMGAHMWFSGMEIVDIAGLIDIPMGHHKWEEEFVAEYVFEQRRPDFAHVHDSWASRLGVRKHREWRTDYVEIPTFPVSKRKHHIGSHVRRELFMRPQWPHPGERAVDFDGGLKLEGWHLRAPVIAAGDELLVEMGWSRRPSMADARVLLVLHGQGRTITRELPLAYDWLPMKRWKKGEVAVSKHRVDLPADLPQGTYDLGFVVLGDKGVRSALNLPQSAADGEPVVARGEVRWANAFQVAPADAVRQHALERWNDRGETLDCSALQTLWGDARRHFPRGDAFAAELWAVARRPVLDCWLDRVQDPIYPRHIRVDAGVAARRLERLDARVHRVTRAYASELAERAGALEGQGDIDEAFWHLSDSLRLDPAHAWRRRHAEKLRDQRLNIVREVHGIQRLFGQDLLE